MSMKRSKQRNSGSSRSSGSEDEPAPWAKAEGPEPTWADIESKPEQSFKGFALSSRYAKGDLILHPKFGRGLVLGVEGTRIEVLFQEGKKKLGHAS